MRTSDFDFHLPKGLIAQSPPPRRDSSRLLVMGPGEVLSHERFGSLHEHLGSGDMLVMNRTRVTPVRLTGKKPSGAELQILLVRDLGDGKWEIMSRGSYTGPLDISPSLGAEISNGQTARLLHKGELVDILWDVGQMPLPPYIRRRPDETDKERYQTVYATEDGSIAAPTAGLHFTPELIGQLMEKGVKVRYITLHVGRGTFVPIRAGQLSQHRMEAEEFEIERTVLEEIKEHRGRLIAVGTTTTRALEAFFSGHYTDINANGPEARANAGNRNGSVRGTTDIFIYPGYEFRAVSGLLTNFHLPGSTPLMLASALAGHQRLMEAYAEAIGENYRFFSYGDAMLIL